MAEENTEDKKEGGEEQSAAPKKALPLVPILLGLQLLTVLGAAFVILRGTAWAPKPDFSREAMVSRAIASVKDDENKIQLMNLDTFLVNVAESHQLRATIQLELSNPEVMATINRRMPAVKQRVLDVLSRTIPDSIHTLSAKLRLKESIKEALNQELIESGVRDGVVRDVYFVDLLAF